MGVVRDDHGQSLQTVVRRRLGVIQTLLLVVLS
jgi:hypothetical protein